MTTTPMRAPWQPRAEQPESREDEPALLAALAAGDRGAAERLVERTYRGVFALQLRLCNGDRDLAADLAQETYRRAWIALAGFDGRARFSTWLFRIAYTTFLNHLRRPRLFQPWEEGMEAAFSDPAPSLEEALGRARTGKRLRQAVLALPEELQFTVIALFWGDLSIQEVAEQEGITGMGVRKRLKRALRALATALDRSEKEVVR